MAAAVWVYWRPLAQAHGERGVLSLAAWLSEYSATVTATGKTAARLLSCAACLPDTLMLQQEGTSHGLNPLSSALALPPLLN